MIENLLALQSAEFGVQEISLRMDAVAATDDGPFHRS